MTDLISRQDALSAVGASLIGQLAIKGDTAEWREVLKSANEMILELPSAQTERKRGKWIEYSMKGIDLIITGWRCSVCGTSSAVPDNNYCPNCGADMRGGEK